MLSLKIAFYFRGGCLNRDLPDVGISWLQYCLYSAKSRYRQSLRRKYRFVL